MLTTVTTAASCVQIACAAVNLRAAARFGTKLLGCDSHNLRCAAVLHTPAAAVTASLPWMAQLGATMMSSADDANGAWNIGWNQGLKLGGGLGGRAHARLQTSAALHSHSRKRSSSSSPLIFLLRLRYAAPPLRPSFTCPGAKDRNGCCTSWQAKHEQDRNWAVRKPRRQALAPGKG